LKRRRKQKLSLRGLNGKMDSMPERAKEASFPTAKRQIGKHEDEKGCVRPAR